MHATLRANLSLTLVVTTLCASTVVLQVVRDRHFPQPSAGEELLYIPSGDLVRRLVLPYRMLAADAYWIRAIQHYGGTKRQEGGDKRYRLLYPLLDITTTLDPRFNIAYRFGSVFLAEAYPSGPGRPDLAVALLERGLRERPEKWEYMQDIGFVHYWYVHDYAVAAGWFKKASDVPGAPWMLRSLAATTLAQGGDRRSSRTMWEAIRQSAEIDWLRKDAERRIVQLQALDIVDALQRVVDDYTRRTGEHPDWAALVRARVLPGIPVDPAGTPFALTPDGRVRLSPSSSLWPPPDEPGGVPRAPS
jgi:hypothetical protein